MVTASNHGNGRLLNDWMNRANISELRLELGID